MCIGIPVQVEAVEGLRAHVWGRGRRAWIDLRLVGPCAVGDWLLAFQGAARERIDARRAAEIDAALDLLEAALAGHHDPRADPGFALPSAMSAKEVAALAGTVSSESAR